MSTKKQQKAKADIPYFNELESFYKHIKARPPLDRDFDIRLIDPEVLKNYDYVAEPFRHSFYCITLFLKGDGMTNAGFWKTKLQKPALYFKTPHQVVSWNKPSGLLHEYFIVFTESFIRNNKILADIIFDLPFFNMEQAVPFEIESDEVELLTTIYQQVLIEYRSSNVDKFSLITAYVHTLLLHVNRLYSKYIKEDKKLDDYILDHEHLIVKKFRSLVKKSLANGESNTNHLTVKHFAEQLSIHPNHLNAVIKRQKQKTAIAFLHEQISYEAQTLLSQTELSNKQISFRLGFSDDAHFNHFFKKQTGKTPTVYRKEKNL